MRLLDTTTLTLHEFIGDSVPPYAILSHRWENEEVTFQDLEAGRGPKMAGWLKILGCCNVAAMDGWQYAWIDSCCIDKKSSAELSEAINSMFQWYRKSEVCYVYMSDVTMVPTGLDGDTHQRENSEFRRSKWFTRGWTLQELIAPLSVVFYDRQWRELGTRKLLEKLISEITGISHFHFQNYAQASAAQKMSWASKRVTTRVEDHAYSLMGLFDVNMPTLYGEGWRAFERLQFEILAKSEDESILAWNSDVAIMESTSLLADTPAVFAGSGNIYPIYGDKKRPPFMMTNRGLQMELFLLPTSEEGEYLVPLNCTQKGITGFVSLVILWPASVCEIATRWTRCQRKGKLTTIHDYKEPPKRAVLFVEPKYSTIWKMSVRDIFHYLPITFSLNITSPVPDEFAVFQEGRDECHPERMAIRHVAEYGQGTGRRIRPDKTCEVLYLCFVSYGCEYYGLLKSHGENWDSFVVILRTDRLYEPSVQLFIPQRKLNWDREVDAYLKSWHDFAFATDRISRTMRTGRSVSAALRRRPDPETLLYELDITVDHEGKLPWPDLN